MAIGAAQMKKTPSTAAKDCRACNDKSDTIPRPVHQFRDFVRASPTAKFPAQKDRYVLYIHPGCPWAHRTVITRLLKGLNDVVQLIMLDSMDPERGWHFSGTNAGPSKDPIYGVKYLRELYERAEPGYSGRVLIPMLWDKKTHTVVSTDSGDIIRMFYESFDEFIPEDQREAAKGKGSLFPPHLRPQIEEMNEWVHSQINNGVYKAGFATSQATYEDSVYALFDALDRLEQHLSEPDHSPYLFGEHITEADIRLFPTLVRFDVAYHTIFKCNLKMIRHDYPRIHDWMRKLYWHPTVTAFRDTTRFDLIKNEYTRTTNSGIKPVGPLPDILPLKA